MRLIAALEAGRRHLLEATRDVAPAQAIATPPAGGWSILECIEHIISLEARYTRAIENGSTVSPMPNPDKEIRLFASIRSRLTKLEAPDAFRPVGRFAQLASALAEFNDARNRSIHLVKSLGEALYSRSAKHPYFGSLNGVEWVQMIDAHARRHTDQIVEIKEAILLSSQASMPHRRKQPITKRDAPDLPSEFAPAQQVDRLFTDGDSVTIQDHHLADLQHAALSIGGFRLEGCVLERIQLTGAQFGSADWKDVRLVDCDLSNVRAHRLNLLRVEFINCRLTGLTATASEWRDVLIQNGDAGYAQLQGGRFGSCEFDNCNWQDSDLQNADLAGSVFRSCNLKGADLRGSKLQKTDFRRSEVEGMLVEMSDLRGAIVDPAQAMILARVLGLEIKG